MGCLSGAILKEAYLKAIRDAGFENVEVKDETFFPIEYMANDPTAQAVIENLSLPEEAIQGITSSAASVKVYGRKPKML
ncbi:MAG: hypothetical protein HY709_03175 [Candidatus Latescibacteria bacterium]|nr:hypothetical protein [Candidatus Latescibacterota bacterium]